MSFNENLQALDAADHDIQNQLLEDLRRGVLNTIQFQEGLDIMDELHRDEMAYIIINNKKK